MDCLFIFDIMAILSQFLAVIFAYQIYRYNRLSKGWLALILAFVMQVIRRTFQTYVDLGYGVNFEPVFDRIFMFLISLLMAFGLWAMMNNFENFEVVETQTKIKVNRVGLLKNKNLRKK